MNPEYVSSTLSIIAFLGCIALALLYNRMDARYVQLSVFRDYQERATKDHETRDKKLDDIHAEVKTMSIDLGKIRGDIEYERGVRKGKAEK
jgi:hypothetical protein